MVVRRGPSETALVGPGSVTGSRDIGAVAPLLDGGTQLVHGGVGLRYWPDSDELVAYVPSPPRVDDGRPDLDARSDRGEDGHAANAARASRRARGRLRRYVSANGLTRMMTLTYAPTILGASAIRRVGALPSGTSSLQVDSPHQAGGDGRCVDCGRPIGPEGAAAAMRDAAAFMRRLRRALDVDAMPYALVPELHPTDADGHVHLHLAVGVNLDRDLLVAAWGHGFVTEGWKVRDDGGGRAAARKAGSYLAKYLAKAFEAGVPHRHRYEVGQGYQPAVVKRSGFRTLDDALMWVLWLGHRLNYVVRSEDLDDYEGAPFIWAVVDSAWDAPP